jgi:hypothetical protein
LYGKTRYKKIGLVGVLTTKENHVVVSWVLVLQYMMLGFYFGKREHGLYLDLGAFFQCLSLAT